MSSILSRYTPGVGVTTCAPNFCAGPAGPQGPAGGVGPTGTQGFQGLTGPAGFATNTGPTGTQGPQGNQGFTGPVGINGTQGNQGPAGAGTSWTSGGYTLELTSSGLYFSNASGNGYFTINGVGLLAWKGDEFAYVPK